jgi:uncharacterized protein (DUF58 family)
VLDTKVIQQYNSLEFVVNQLVEGFMTGLHKSPFHGFSVEFAEHRVYNPGESVKNIDWKLYGRTDKLFVKRFEEETNLRCYLLIDNSSSMHYPVVAEPSIKTPDKITFSVYAAACITQLLQQQRDAVGLSVFSEDIDLFTPIRSSIDHQKFLFAEYEKLINSFSISEKKKSNVAASLHLIAEKIHKRSLIVIFSDMFDTEANIDDMFNAIQHLKYNKNEVILFHVVDKDKEINLDFPDKPIKFIDLESNTELKINPKILREDYSELLSKRKEEIELRCLQYQIDFVEVDINQGYNSIMLNFLKKRQKLH